MLDGTDGGASDDHGGANDQDHNADSGNNKDTDNKDDLIPRAAAERWKKDLLRWKDTAKESERKLAEVTERLEAIEAEKDGNDFKAQAERYKREADELKSKLGQTNESFIYSAKYNSVYKELKKLGLRDDAERFLEYEDLRDLEIETTSKGRVNVLGADDWAADYKRRNTLLFEQKKAPRVDSSDGRTDSGFGESGDITPAQIVEAERLAKKTGKPEHDKQYRALIAKYQEQRRKGKS